jgi:quinol monooxygenase YgiN
MAERTPDHAHIVRIARYRPDPGQEAALLSQLQALAEAMRPLPGLFGAQVCRIQEDRDWLVLISRWENELAMRGVATGPAAAATEAVAQLAERQEVMHLLPV